MWNANVLPVRPVFSSDTCADTAVAVDGQVIPVAGVHGIGDEFGGSSENLLVDAISEINCTIEAQLRLLPRLLGLRPDLAERPCVRSAAANIVRPTAPATGVSSESAAGVVCADGGAFGGSDDRSCHHGQCSGRIVDDGRGIHGNNITHSQGAPSQCGQDGTCTPADVADHALTDRGKPNAKSVVLSWLLDKRSAQSAVNTDQAQLAPAVVNHSKIAVDLDGESHQVQCSAEEEHTVIDIVSALNSRVKSEPGNVELWPMFEDCANSASATRVFKVNNTDTDRASPHDSILTSKHRWCRRIPLVRPDGLVHLCRDLTCILVIFFEVITIPLTAFTEETSFMVRMSVVSTIFWTLEIVTNFFVGVHTKHGSIEMRPLKIAKHYVLSKWFFADTLVVTLDWLLFLGNRKYVFAVRIARFIRVARILRVLKFARILRIGRILKLKQLFGEVNVWVSSAVGVAFLRILEGLLGVYLFCHVLGCAWYAIGKNDFLTGSPQTWLSVQNRLFPDDAVTISYWYLICVQFSFALFTPSPPPRQISPVNFLEQLFVNVTLLIGFVFFTCFASSVTSTVLILKKHLSQKASEEIAVREYLEDHSVSSRLASRTLLWLRYRGSSARVITLETDASLIRELPAEIIRALRSEVHRSAIVLHPLFRKLYSERSKLPQQLCLSAVSQKICRQGDLPFRVGDPATHAFFVHPPHSRGLQRIVLHFWPPKDERGTIDFEAIESEDELAREFSSGKNKGQSNARGSFASTACTANKFLSEEDVFGETALWLVDAKPKAPSTVSNPWRRDCSVDCLRSCCLTTLSGAEFRSIILTDGVTSSLVRKYARRFAELIEAADGYRDMFRMPAELEEIVSNECPHRSGRPSSHWTVLKALMKFLKHRRAR